MTDTPLHPSQRSETHPQSVRISLDDRTMGRILDDLTERSGRQRGTDALGLARWDLKAVLERWGVDRGPTL